MNRWYLTTSRGRGVWGWKGIGRFIQFVIRICIDARRECERRRFEIEGVADIRVAG